MQEPRSIYKHLTLKECDRFIKWIHKNKVPENSAWIRWEEILSPSDDFDAARRKAINAARIASAQRYAKESRNGKSGRAKYGSKKRDVVQVSRKQLQEQERNQRTKSK